MRVTITFTDTLASLLVQYANKSNVSLASVVRLALSEFFERQQYYETTKQIQRKTWEQVDEFLDNPEQGKRRTRPEHGQYFDGVYLPRPELDL